MNNLLHIYLPPRLARELSDVEGSKPEVWQSENENQKQGTRAKNKIRGGANFPPKKVCSLFLGEKTQRPLKWGGAWREKVTWSK